MNVACTNIGVVVVIARAQDFLTVGYGGREAVEDWGVIANAETTAAVKRPVGVPDCDARQGAVCKTQQLAARDIADAYIGCNAGTREVCFGGAVCRRATLTKREDTRVWCAVRQFQLCLLYTSPSPRD